MTVSDWQAVVAPLEPAAFVAVRLVDGRRLRGTVLAAGDTTFTFQPRTRIPAPPREIRYDAMVGLERPRQGTSPGMKVLISAGAGVGGVILIFLSILAQSD